MLTTSEKCSFIHNIVKSKTNLTECGKWKKLLEWNRVPSPGKVCILSVWLLDLTYRKTANVTFYLWLVSTVLPAEASVMGTYGAGAGWVRGLGIFLRCKLGICLQE